MNTPKKWMVASLAWREKPGELILTQGQAVEALGHHHQFFQLENISLHLAFEKCPTP